MQEEYWPWQEDMHCGLPWQPCMQEDIWPLQDDEQPPYCPLHEFMQPE